LGHASSCELCSWTFDPVQEHLAILYFQMHQAGAVDGQHGTPIDRGQYCGDCSLDGKGNRIRSLSQGLSIGCRKLLKPAVPSKYKDEAAGLRYREVRLLAGR
jgi:hypothetical protein